MGSGKSVPRKITIDNPEDATTIKVTENVVSRLEDMAKPATATSSVSVPQRTQEASPTTDGAAKIKTATVVADDDVTAKTVYITSHQIRNQIDEAIDSNNAYWENRVKALREGYNRINSELKHEYDTAIAEVNQSWGKQYLVNANDDDTQSCKRTEQEVIRCYNSNRDRSLFCYEQVKNFNQCVSNQTNALLKAN